MRYLHSSWNKSHTASRYLAMLSLHSPPSLHTSDQWWSYSEQGLNAATGANCLLAHKYNDKHKVCSDLTMYFERGSRSGVYERCEKWANKVPMDFGEGGRFWEEVWLFLHSQLGRRIELLRPRDVDSSGGRQRWSKSLSLTEPPS